VNANLSDYMVPVNADVPALDAAFLSARDDIADPIGVKGLGEVVMVGVPGAIANAVYNATGRRMRDLPITIEQLLWTETRQRREICWATGPLKQPNSTPPRDRADRDWESAGSSASCNHGFRVHHIRAATGAGCGADSRWIVHSGIG
jgi:hypothetical protein